VKTTPRQRGSSCTFIFKFETMKKVFIAGSGDDPTFDLPLENELLMLKLKAEFGAECTTGTDEIPPSVVNEFLRSVYEFERKFREPRPMVRIYEKIGQPFFRGSGELGDRRLSAELKRLLIILKAHGIELDVMGEYPDRVIYRFITEELFQYSMEDLVIPGFIHHFCYEDFHPNHELDIRQRAVEFLSQWFGKQINEFSWQLADPFVHPDSRQFAKRTVLKKIQAIFDSYSSFYNCEYLISKLEFEWSEAMQNGKAFVEGRVRYDAKLESGEVQHVEGSFELYLANAGNWWSIFYFVFPGYNWNS
jgi:hypothetical protein